MAPLVPDIIGNEFNFVVALLAGIGFGFVLEQAGFSTTKKLVGLFYGYDFTVLKVFFTAGITAMVGVILLGHWGLLDLEMVYVNPTFLRSALIGGAIMGAGFIIGGFCPGTSICALATGKIDAFWFIFGSLFGILAFMEFFPSFEKMYMADNMGLLRMDKFLGISKELFGILLTAIAILAFVVTQKIENKLRGVKPVYSKITVVNYSIFAAIPFIIIAFVALTPDRNQRILTQSEDINKQEQAKVLDADKLSIELVNKYYKLNLIDVRSPEKFKEYHLPLAINIPLDSMLNREYQNFFTQEYKTNIFYADENQVARKAYVIATKLGNADLYILKENTEQFRNMIMEGEKFPESASKSEQHLRQYRAEMAQTINELDARLKTQLQPVKKQTKKVKGGCS
jgi:hypothetical protein